MPLQLEQHLHSSNAKTPAPGDLSRNDGCLPPKKGTTVKKEKEKESRDKDN